MVNRICTECGDEKNLDEFARKKEGREGRANKCKACQRAYVKRHYQENKKHYKNRVALHNRKRREEYSLFIKWLKDVPCADCGQRLPDCAMDFDHVRGRKLFDVSHMKYYSYSREKLVAEILKCEVVCANCHRIRTHLGRPVSSNGRTTPS